MLEFYPAFAHGGYVYASAYSVAQDRNFIAIFRAPIKRATDPAAWELFRHGSVWHNDDSELGGYGLWGQTLAGQVDAGGTLWAMFNTLDSKTIGAVNLAQRPWSKPFRDRGFVLSGNRAEPDLPPDGVRKFQAGGDAGCPWDGAALLGFRRAPGTERNSA